MKGVMFLSDLSKVASVDEMKASLKLLLDVGNGQACLKVSVSSPFLQA